MLAICIRVEYSWGSMEMSSDLNSDQLAISQLLKGNKASFLQASGSSYVKISYNFAMYRFSPLNKKVGPSLGPTRESNWEWNSTHDKIMWNFHMKRCIPPSLVIVNWLCYEKKKLVLKVNVKSFKVNWFWSFLGVVMQEWLFSKSWFDPLWRCYAQY